MSMVQRLATGLLLGVVADGFRVRPQRRVKPAQQKVEKEVKQLQEEGRVQMRASQPDTINPDDFPKCHLSKSDCLMKDMTQATLVYTDSDTSRCWNGDPFAFLVHPGPSDKLLLYFAGGGACFDNPSGQAAARANNASVEAVEYCITDFVGGLTATGYGLGAQDYNDPRNFFQDYAAVSAPYCTGGAHIANTTVDNGDGTLSYQYDYSNNEFARGWVMKNFGHLESFVLMGSSAGSLGAAVWADFLLSTFKYEKASIIMDSYMGIFPPNTQGPMMQQWGICQLPPLSTFRGACEAGTLQVVDILDETIARHPKVAFAHVQAKGDGVQRLFYTAVGLAYGGWNFYISDKDLYKASNTMMERFNKHPNYVAYLVDGAHHVFTPSDIWYTATVAGKDKAGPSGTPTLVDWAAKLVAHEQVNSECMGSMKGNGGGLWSGTKYCYSKLFPKTLAV